MTILTDIQLANPLIVCPITATLTPAAGYIGLSGDFTTISVDATSIVVPTDYGITPFTLTVASANFPGSVATQTYVFNVDVSCPVTSLTITS